MKIQVVVKRKDNGQIIQAGMLEISKEMSAMELNQSLQQQSVEILTQLFLVEFSFESAQELEAHMKKLEEEELAAKFAINQEPKNRSIIS